MIPIVPALAILGGCLAYLATRKGEPHGNPDNPDIRSRGAVRRAENRSGPARTEPEPEPEPDFDTFCDDGDDEPDGSGGDTGIPEGQRDDPEPDRGEGSLSRICGE